jgi:hypothetical protein
MKKLCLLFVLLFFLSGCKSPDENVANYILFEQDGFTIIKTKAENIKPETIREPICSDYIKELGYYGINAGFFDTVFRGEKPADEDFVSVSIAWSKEDAEKGLEVCEFSKRDWERIALGEGPYIARGTLFLYIDGEQYKAGIITAETCDDVRAQMKSRTGNDYDYIYMIGGGNFYLNEYPNLEDWDKWIVEKYTDEGPLVIETKKTGRSGIGIKKENGIWYTYLVASETNGKEIPKTLEELRALFISLECSDAIYLDGAGSSQMICRRDNGELIEKSGDNRYIWAMVRLVNN